MLSTDLLLHVQDLEAIWNDYVSHIGQKIMALGHEKGCFGEHRTRSMFIVKLERRL